MNTIAIIVMIALIASFEWIDEKMSWLVKCPKGPVAIKLKKYNCQAFSVDIDLG